MKKSVSYSSLTGFLTGFGIPGTVTIVIALIISTGLIFEYHFIINEYKKEFYKTEQQKAEANVQAIQNLVTQLYQGLRTIARLPGTRRLDLETGRLEANARESIQEIYNNLYSSIRLSEIYLVPGNFDSNHTDSRTGKPMSPTATFDQYIVGKNAAGKASYSMSTVLPEIEIHEYRLMTQQAAWFSHEYPNEALIEHLAYPALSGEEVITCDNTMVSPANVNDLDRSGIVYSVPFYSLKGRFKGMVSGVVLTNVLRSALNSDNYILVNSNHKYLVHNQPKAKAATNKELALTGIPDPNLIYSQLLPVPVIDNGSEWMLWAGTPNEEFWNAAHVRAETHLITVALLLVASITGGLLYMLHAQQREKILTDSANRAKSEFLSRMSHELRTPLNSIIGFSDIIMEDARNVGQTQTSHDAQNIRAAGFHLLALIDEILDLTKIDAGRMEFNPINFEISTIIELVTETTTPLIHKNKNKLVVDRAHTLGTMIADEKRVTQILLNLLSNAAKFTRKGTISLSVQRQPRGNIDMIFFTVKDNGIGISEAQQEKIFQEFTQADNTIAGTYGGSGLGLAITRKLCELMHGGISVASSPGKGSTFTVFIPAEPIGKHTSPQSTPNPGEPSSAPVGSG